MDQEENSQKSQSSSISEATPLLKKKEPADLYTKEISQENVAEDSAVAGTSRTTERNEANPSEADEGELEERQCRENEEEELADAVNSYEGMADLVSPALGCGLFYGIWLCVCHCLSSFMVQFPLHFLLLSLPIAVGFMGARYMTECPLNPKLPHAMMVLGSVGTLVLLVRLALLLHTKFSNDELLKKWLKNGMRLLEFVFLISLIFEICFSYDMSPASFPISPNYCNDTFYSFVCKVNNVLITLVVVWIFLYCVTVQRCTRRASPP